MTIAYSVSLFESNSGYKAVLEEAPKSINQRSYSITWVFYPGLITLSNGLIHLLTDSLPISLQSARLAWPVLCFI